MQIIGSGPKNKSSKTAFFPGLPTSKSAVTNEIANGTALVNRQSAAGIYYKDGSEEVASIIPGPLPNVHTINALFYEEILLCTFNFYG